MRSIHSVHGTHRHHDKENTINPLKADIHLHYWSMYKLSSYPTQNTVHLHYKNLAVYIFARGYTVVFIKYNIKLDVHVTVHRHKFQY